MEAQIEQLTPRLRAGASQLGIDLGGDQVDRLMRYLALFSKWNQTYNLSAVRDPAEMVHRHLLDSLSVVPHLRNSQQPLERVIDVGTGGGLPGIPLAILFPDTQFTLLDSAGKKSRFLFQVKVDLGLNNVTVENCRVESFKPQPLFDVVISRAFASLLDMVQSCKHLLTSQGQFWAMKGIYPQDELSALPKHYKVVDSFALSVPGSEGERHLLVLADSSEPHCSESNSSEQGLRRQRPHAQSHG